eukprot:2626261-Lingulodinium_polyedra.AAC.1
MDKLPWQLPANAIEALETLVEDVVRVTTEAEDARVQADTDGGDVARAAQDAQTSQNPARRSPTGRPV